MGIYLKQTLDHEGSVSGSPIFPFYHHDPIDMASALSACIIVHVLSVASAMTAYIVTPTQPPTRGLISRNLARF